MGPTQRSPKYESSREREDDGDKDDRKRVCKACDRCRLKKSKCDGQNPCNRCHADNSVCVYGQRKKATEKIYPKGYTDQLVADQARLVKCVHQLYEHCLEADVPLGFPKLERRPSGKFFTHDILKSMDLLGPMCFEEDEEEAVFYDNPAMLLREMEAKQEIEKRQEEEIKHETASASSQNTSMHMRNGSMSRTPSRDGVPYPGSIHIPGHSQFHNTPGGLMPPTPGQSPSKEGPQFDQFFSHSQPSINTLNRPTFLPQHFTGPPPAPGMYAPAFGNPYGQPNFGQPPISYSATPSPYMQQPPLLPGHSPYMQHSALPPGPPMEMPTLGGPFTTLAQSHESPTLAVSALQDQLPTQQQIWTSASLQSANDPVMGFDYQNIDEELGENDQYNF